MEVNRDHLIESDKQITLKKHKKKQIILGHTGSNMSEFITKVTTRYNKKYDKLPAFVIGLDGTIFQLYEPDFYSNFMEDESVDKISVPIVLENVGWLTKDPRDNNYYDWKGHQYDENSVITKEWRNKKYWAEYKEEQFESLIWLINIMCDRFRITKTFVGDNVTVHKPKTFKGIINRSNYYKAHYDLSPAMNFDKLNDRINSLPKLQKIVK